MTLYLPFRLQDVTLDVTGLLLTQQKQESAHDKRWS